MFTHILVPTDGSALSQKAVDGAISLAKALGARVTAYACQPEYPVTPYTDVVVEAPADFSQRAESEARAHLQAVELAAAAAGVRCTTLTSIHASPYVGIVEAAENSGCDMIMMASHGRSGLSNLLIGSETNRVLSHTTIPVMIYR